MKLKEDQFREDENVEPEIFVLVEGKGFFGLSVDSM